MRPFFRVAALESGDRHVVYDGGDQGENGEKHKRDEDSSREDVTGGFQGRELAAGVGVDE